MMDTDDPDYIAVLDALTETLATGTRRCYTTITDYDLADAAGEDRDEYRRVWGPDR
jgi:hypothetical protein